MHLLPLYMTEFFIQVNPNLDRGNTRHAILSNWGINVTIKSWGTLKNRWKIRVEKCNLPFNLFYD